MRAYHPGSITKLMEAYYISHVECSLHFTSEHSSHMLNAHCISPASISLIVTKSNLCLPNLIFGRVVWTFQLCTNRTLQLCAYKVLMGATSVTWKEGASP